MLVPLLAGAAPLVVLVIGFLVTGALGLPLAFTLALTSLTYLLGIGGVGLVILPIKILGGVDSFVLLAIPLFILAGALMESGGISERIVDLAMAIVGQGPRRPGDGRGRRRDPVLRHLRIDGGGRLGDQLAAGARRCGAPATRARSRSASSRRPRRWASWCRRA